MLHVLLGSASRVAGTRRTDYLTTTVVPFGHPMVIVVDTVSATPLRPRVTRKR